MWRYDVGGYAWDNSELSPDLWLWYAFLRSGRADIFRFAEAMTRHTGEVDVYHLGQWAGLGTRHGVQHWADSAKQQRISTADLPADLLLPDRRRADRRPDVASWSTRTGRSWCSTRSARSAPSRTRRTRTRCRSGSAPTGAAWPPRGSPSGKRRGPKADAREVEADGHDGDHRGDAERLRHRQRRCTTWTPAGSRRSTAKAVSVSHLSAMFGQVEMCAELIGLVDLPAFEARLAAVLPAVQRDPGGADGRVRRVLRQPDPAAGARAAHRVRGRSAGRRRPGRPCVAGVLHRRRLRAGPAVDQHER